MAKVRQTVTKTRKRKTGGYSGADDFRMELQELMQDAPNEQIKMKLQRLMSEM